MSPTNLRTFNVVVLGIGFLFVFTAFTTCGNIEVRTGEKHSCCSSQCISSINLQATMISEHACIIVAVVGPQFTMIISGILYSGYIAVFINPSSWSFYLTSLLIGLGAAMLWTAQGHLLVENSDVSTINRNTGIFWAFLQCSMLFGNLYIYLAWTGKTEITDANRRILFIALLVISVLGTLSFLTLRRAWQREEALTEEEGQALLSARLLGTKTILLLSSCMAYSGLELSFYSGVFGTCIGATTQFGDSALGLIGLSGIVVGVGEIVGGGLFGLVCKNNRFRRTSVVFLGMVVHFVAFYLIFLNIPDDAPVVFYTSTQQKPYLTPRYVPIQPALKATFSNSKM
uniref:Uncharacterized protein n=1 Tax=Denticeps clupeoides TaxID=299321 RepID=A0AAY4CRQ5_9TELE